MENPEHVHLKHIHIINQTIKYALNREVVKAKGIHIADEVYGLKVEKILGADVHWLLVPFRIVDIYEYFENQLMQNLFDRLLNPTIDEYCNRYESLISWTRVDAQEQLHIRLAKYGESVGIDWPTQFDKLINHLAKEGFMGDYIYYNAISGYFESVAKEYFEINVSSVRYQKVDNLGQTKITFYDGNCITINKDFFTNKQFFNDPTRFATTDDFLKNIKDELKELIWDQKSSI